MNAPTFTGIEVPARQNTVATTAGRPATCLDRLVLDIFKRQTAFDFESWAEKLIDEAAEHGARHVHIPGPQCPEQHTVELTQQEARLLAPFASAAGRIRIQLFDSASQAFRDVRNYRRDSLNGPGIDNRTVWRNEHLYACVLEVSQGEEPTARISLRGELEYST